MGTPTILDENGKVRLELETDGETAVIRPVGTIDEDVNFSVIVQTLAGLQPAVKRLVFDMGHVSRMNSCGVREWILLMERMSAGLPLSFANVNELFIEQANMIPGMFGRKGAVVSFQSPYHCAKCDKDVSVLLRPKDVAVADGEPKAPEQKCPDCSTPLEFDWLEDEYFAFITRL